MKAGDPQAWCYELSEHVPVRLSVCPPWHDGQAWRPRGSRLSWAEEVASPGLDSPQLKGFTSFMAA